MNEKELDQGIEAIVFASHEPIQPSMIMTYLEDIVPLEAILASLERLIAQYQERQGGIVLQKTEEGGYIFETSAQGLPYVQKMFQTRNRPLSRAAQETLAIIAYRQPVTRADIEYIRGVDSGSILKNLLDKGMVECTGRLDDVGRPMVFATTEEFLRVYGLGTLKDLPPVAAFQPDPGQLIAAEAQLTETTHREAPQEIEL